MRGLSFDKNLSYRVDLPQPAPGEGEALIRVLGAGVCQTDLEIIKGYMGFRGIPGHEFVGEVVSSGPLKGKRVVGEINCECGTCPTCQSGLRNHCPHRTVLGICGRNGCFAEFTVLPEDNLHPLPESLSVREALFAEPLAAAFQVLQQAPLRGDERVIVLGDGRLGLLVAQVLNSRCRELLLVGKHPEKLQIAARLGLNTVLAENGPLDERADLVVDATGSIQGLSDALSLVRPRGTIVMKTTVAQDYKIDLSDLVINEVRVVGSRCGPFPDALRALEKREVRVAPLVTAELPLSSWKEAFAKASSDEAVKVIFRIGAAEDEMENRERGSR